MPLSHDLFLYHLNPCNFVHEKVSKGSSSLVIEFISFIGAHVDQFVHGKSKILLAHSLNEYAKSVCKVEVFLSVYFDGHENIFFKFIVILLFFVF